MLLFFSEPVPRRDARNVIGLAPSKRVTSLLPGQPLSDYASGVVTMERATVADMADGRWSVVGCVPGELLSTSGDEPHIGGTARN